MHRDMQPNEVEQLITLEEARKLLPSSRNEDGHPDLTTIKRWARSGLKGIKLRTIRAGGETVCTTRAWIRDWLVALNNGDDSQVINYSRPEAADRILDNAGI